jgi:hypothetical protein
VSTSRFDLGEVVRKIQSERTNESRWVVRLKASRTVKWAGVEFQPNLQKPGKPVRLGVALLVTEPKSKSLCVIGRNASH